MLRSTLTAAISLLVAALPACAQEETDPHASYSPGQLREDFIHLHETLENAHFDLYAATPRAVFDQRRAEILADLDAPMTRSEAMILFQTYAALARHGHARLDFPFEAWSEWRDSGGGGFPVDIRIRDGRVLVAGHNSGVEALQPGDEILAINGEPNAIWLPRLTRHLSAETPLLAYTLLESYLPGLVWMEYPDASALDLRVRHANGEVETLTIPLLSREDGAAMADTRAEAFSLAGFESRLLEDDIAYLRPGAFYNTEPDGNVWDATGYTARVDAAFEDFIDNGADTLILDLRDNSGGDNSFSDPIIAWFADQPFRFASRFTIRISEATTAANAARLADQPASTEGVSALFAQMFAEHENGESVEFEIPIVEPREGTRFEGEVYVLVNRYSYSNAVTTAALIQDYGFGTIAGEATADMSTTYGAMEHFTLPHTGIRVGYPKAHIIRPNGDEHPHGVSPDIELVIPALRGATDHALEELIGRITTSR